MGLLGGGLVFTPDLVLSQQTEPLLQFEVLGINTDGRSQNAAIMYNIQKPGHFGNGDLKEKIAS